MSIINKLISIPTPRFNVIEINSLYMAYFKTSYENRTVWNTYQYELEYLIEIPNNKLDKDYVPRLIKLEGNTEGLDALISSLSRGIKVDISYNNILKEGVDYSLIKEGKQEILESGIELLPKSSNQIDYISNSLDWSYERFSSDVITGSIDISGTYTDPMFVTGSGVLQLMGSPLDEPLIFSKPIQYNRSYYTSGSSTEHPISYSLAEGYISLQGPHLAVFHTYNQCIYQEIIYNGDPNSEDVGVIEGLDPDNNYNYIKWVPYSSDIEHSGLPYYKNTKEPFLLEINDEIRINYQYSSGSVGNEVLHDITQDFRITGIPSRSVTLETETPYTFDIKINNSGSFRSSGSLNNIFDQIQVSPDPSTLTHPIPDGRIYAYTIRKRSKKDSQILVSTPIPIGSKGVLTQSGGGFIIPNTFTPLQRENSTKIVNILKSQNIFEKEDGIGNNIMRIDPQTGEIYVWV